MLDLVSLYFEGAWTVIDAMERRSLPHKFVMAMRWIDELVEERRARERELEEATRR